MTELYNNNNMKIEAFGIATKSSCNEILSVYFPYIKFGDKQTRDTLPSLNNSYEKVVCSLADLQKPIKDIQDAYLRLHLLSYRFVLPNSINLDGLFKILPNIIWTNQGAMLENEIERKMKESHEGGSHFFIRSIDKFPVLTDYIIPKGVRIADSTRVRLGAYLSEGTTIMHEGFVNFNAGTLGPCMIEGRVSAGVVIGANSDLGGGSSTMGTLSGGNNIKISVGENSLLGANSGLGIPLGNNCIIEAGLYITAGTKVTLKNKKIVKASTLSNIDNLLFIRNSVNGNVEVKENLKVVSLNSELHKNI